MKEQGEGGDSETERVETSSIAAYSFLLLAADISPPGLVVQALGKMGAVTRFLRAVEDLEVALGSMVIP
jgi:hypothetical protein